MSLGHGSVVGRESHQMEPLELVAKVAPGLPGLILGDPDQQQGQPADADVGPNAAFRD